MKFRWEQICHRKRTWPLKYFDVGFDPFIHLLWKGEMAICPNFVIFLVSWQFMPSLYNFMNLVLSGLGEFFAFSLLFMRYLKKNTQKTLMYVYHTTICHEIENKTDSLIDSPHRYFIGMLERNTLSGGILQIPCQVSKVIWDQRIFALWSYNQKWRY